MENRLSSQIMCQGCIQNSTWEVLCGQFPRLFIKSGGLTWRKIKATEGAVHRSQIVYARHISSDLSRPLERLGSSESS